MKVWFFPLRPLRPLRENRPDSKSSLPPIDLPFRSVSVAANGMPKKISRLHRMRVSAKALLDENAQHAAKWRRFVHFWVLVGRSFVRNRCPIRASALAYGSLLALIPMLAVVI